MKKETAYFVANSLTMTRAGLGLGSVIAATTGDINTSFFVWLSGFSTEIDGSIARKFKADNLQGELRDALADLIHSPTMALNFVIHGHTQNASPEFMYGWFAMAALVGLIHVTRAKKAWAALATTKVNNPNP